VGGDDSGRRRSTREVDESGIPIADVVERRRRCQSVVVVVVEVGKGWSRKDVTIG
jgi:hypothetical protein